MQIMCDTDTETRESLTLLIRLLSAIRAAKTPNSLVAVPPAPSDDDGTNNIAPLPVELVDPETGAPIPPSPLPPPRVTASSVLPPYNPADGAPDYDTAGVPWDSRIHQKSRGRKKDGSHKLLKGLDNAFVQAILQEMFATGRIKGMPGTLPAAGAPPVSIATAVIPPPPTTPPISVPQDNDDGSPPTLPPAIPPVPVQQIPLPPTPVGPSAAPVPASAPTAIEAAAINFRQLMARVTKAQEAGKLTTPEFLAMAQAAGAPNVGALYQMQNLIPQVWAALDAKLGSFV